MPEPTEDYPGYTEEGIDGFAWNKNNISGEDGVVTFDATDAAETYYTQGDHTYGGTYYQGSIIHSKEFYGYGYYEARMRINATMGTCPGFYLDGIADYSKAESVYYEFDILESYGAMSGTIKATPLKHVVKFTPSEDGTYVLSDTGKYTQLWVPNGEFVTNENGELLAKDNKYYPADVQRYYYKHSTFNAYNTNQFSADNWEILYKGDGEDDSYFANFSGDGEFHTYAFEWTENYIMWIYDGIPVLKYNFCDVDESVGNKFQFRPTEDSPVRIYIGTSSGKNTGGKSGLPVECDCEGDTCLVGPAVHTDWDNCSSLEVDYVYVREY